MSRSLPAAGEFYRHFKGNLYQVIGLANDAGTMQKVVVYRALSKEGAWYVRSLEEFLSPVDREKYPDAAAEYRFEQVVPEQVFGKPDVSGEVQEAQKMSDFAEKAAEGADVEMREIKTSRFVFRDGTEEERDLREEQKEKERREREIDWDNPEAEKVRPELLRFLDAETPAEKLVVLREIRGKLDGELMTSIELSIDLMPDDKETLERRLSLVEKNLEKRVRYEGGRLR